jgi:hypothetical protein
MAIVNIYGRSITFDQYLLLSAYSLLCWMHGLDYAYFADNYLTGSRPCHCFNASAPSIEGFAKL